jgi:hypothetical protein
MVERSRRHDLRQAKNRALSVLLRGKEFHEVAVGVLHGKNEYRVGTDVEPEWFGPALVASRLQTGVEVIELGAATLERQKGKPRRKRLRKFTLTGSP